MLQGRCRHPSMGHVQALGRDPEFATVAQDGLPWPILGNSAFPLPPITLKCKHFVMKSQGRVPFPSNIPCRGVRGRIHKCFCVRGEDPLVFCARAAADPEGSCSIPGALLAYSNANAH